MKTLTSRLSLFIFAIGISGCVTLATYKGDVKVMSFTIDAPILVVETAIVDYAVLNNLELIAESQRLGLYRLNR